MNKVPNILVVGGTEAQRAKMIKDKLAALKAAGERAVVYDPKGEHREFFNPTADFYAIRNGVTGTGVHLEDRSQPGCLFDLTEWVCDEGRRLEFFDIIQLHKGGCLPVPWYEQLLNKLRLFKKDDLMASFEYAAKNSGDILSGYMTPERKATSFVFIGPGCDQRKIKKEKLYEFSAAAETVVSLANEIISWRKENSHFSCSRFTHFVMGDMPNTKDLGRLARLILFGACSEDEKRGPQKAAVFATMPTSSLHLFKVIVKDPTTLFDEIIDLDAKESTRARRTWRP